MSKKIFFSVILIFLSWRVGLFGLSIVKDIFLPYQTTYAPETIINFTKTPKWIANWANFDGVHYLKIAESGYVGTGLIQAFFPLFPYVILRGFTLLFDTRPWMTLEFALVLNIIFGSGFAVLLYILASRLFSAQKATWILLSFLLFPTSFFLGAIYTEAIFLLLIVATFLAAEDKRWPLVGILVALASATRIVGICLVPALLAQVWWEWYRLRRKTSKKKTFQLIELVPLIKPSAWIISGALGLIAYMIYLQIQFHDPLYFFHVQAAFGSGRQQTFVLFPQVVWRSIKIVISNFGWNWRYWTSVWELIAGTLGLAMTLLAARKVKLSYTLFALGCFFVPTLTGNFSSMPRYILVCLPIFFVLGSWSHDSKLFRFIWLPLSTIALLINTVLFLQGYWVG